MKKIKHPSLAEIQLFYLINMQIVGQRSAIEKSRVRIRPRPVFVGCMSLE